MRQKKTSCFQKAAERFAGLKKTATFAHANRPDGGIGRRAGLKHQWIHFHPGSIPGLGTGISSKS
mgnify:FL=1